MSCTRISSRSTTRTITYGLLGRNLLLLLLGGGCGGGSGSGGGGGGGGAGRDGQSGHLAGTGLDDLVDRLARQLGDQIGGAGVIHIDTNAVKNLAQVSSSRVLVPAKHREQVSSDDSHVCEKQ